MDKNMIDGNMAKVTNHLAPPSSPTATGDVELIAADFYNLLMFSVFGPGLQIEAGLRGTDFQRGVTSIRSLLAVQATIKRPQYGQLYAVDRVA